VLDRLEPKAWLAILAPAPGDGHLRSFQFPVLLHLLLASFVLMTHVFTF
jgi:hypothetical protein